MNVGENYFILFGLKMIYTQNKAMIKKRFYELQLKVHPDNFVNATQAEKRQAAALSATVNEAYQVLCSPLKRAIYLLKLHGVDTSAQTNTPMSMAFLNHQMALREQILEDIQAVKGEVVDTLLACEKKLSELLDSRPDEKALEQAYHITREMQFYERLSYEIN